MPQKTPLFRFLLPISGLICLFFYQCGPDEQSQTERASREINALALRQDNEPAQTAEQSAEKQTTQTIQKTGIDSTPRLQWGDWKVFVEPIQGAFSAAENTHIRVYHQQKLVYDTRTGSQELKLGLVPLRVQMGDTVYVKDLDEDGAPELIVAHWTGGVHCCFYWDILHLKPIKDDSIRVTTIFGNHSIPALHYDSKTDKPYFEIYDGVFAYWNASFAESPQPKVFLSFQKGELLADKERMKRLKPSNQEIRERSAMVKQEMEAIYQSVAAEGASQSQFNHYRLPPELWGLMLDLIYSGHHKEADKLLEELWDAKKYAGRASFKKAFEEQLTESIYYKQLKD